MRGGDLVGENETDQRQRKNEIGRLEGQRREWRRNTHSALTLADAMRARSSAFVRLLERSCETILEGSAAGKIAVSFSGGKDSTVLLHMIRCLVPESKEVWFDSGAELQSTREIVEYYDADVMLPQMSMLEICRASGWWGYKTNDLVKHFDLADVLIYEPSRQYMEAEGCTVYATGIRAQESRARHITAKVHGALMERANGQWRLCPLLDWTADDIWAYIASRDIAYNRAYDVMASMGIPRLEQRIGTALGGSNITQGRMAYMKRCEPEMFNRLAAEFPLLRSYA
jgi:phosphoadenosine phosphosulfate reductase